MLEAKPEIGLISGVVAFIDDAGVLNYFPQSLYRGEQYPQDKKKMVELLYPDCVVQIAACMFRRPLAELFPGKYRIIDDWHFLLHVAHRELIWGIPKVLVKMRRGKSHEHLWRDPEWTTRATCEFLRYMYEYYKDDPDSPIDYWLYRKSLSPWLAQRGKYLGGWRGYFNLLQAVLCDPSNQRAWKYLRRLSGRALRKAKRLAVR